MTDLFYGTSGPKDAEVVLVGEAWGADEDAAKRPFVGMSGNELGRILAEAGIDRDRVLMTNVVPMRPQNNQMWSLFDVPSAATATVRKLHPGPSVQAGLDRLYEQIAFTPRRLIVGCGNYPLWALSDVAGVNPPSAETGGRCTPSGIMSWRGSMWYALDKAKTPLLPIIHPAAILRQWSVRAVTVHDLKARVPMALREDWRRSPAPVYWAPPTFDQACLKLRGWISRAEGGERFRIVVDIETARKLITCIGFTDSIHFGMSVPFIKGRTFADYWTHEQEVILLRLMARVLTHENIEIVGQNFIYDTQYIQYYLGVTPRLSFDTMLAQHLLWPGTPKGLDYISSLYCDYHWYWKDDGKEWDTKGSLEDLLKYNCDDLVRTFEAATALQHLITRQGLDRQWAETMERNHLALRMMNRGVLIDRKRRGQIGVQLTDVISRLQGELATIIPDFLIPRDKIFKIGAKNKTPWYSSPKIQQYVFGELLGMKIPKSRSTGNPTLNKEALRELARKNPVFAGIFLRLEKMRSVGVYQSHFIQAPLDADNRMRCSFNPAGTETFRWSSSTNPFGIGTNLQTIPAGDED